MITEAQLERQVKLTDATRRHFPRPQPVRGLKYFQNEIIWEKPIDASWNITHYRVYVNSESNVVREVSADQTHVGDIVGADRVFVSAFNQNSGLESQKLILNTKISGPKDVGSLVHNPGFERGDDGSWRPIGVHLAPPLEQPLSPACTWGVANDSQGRNGPWTGKHVVGTLTSNDALINDAQIECGPGSQFVVTGYAKSSSGSTTGTMYLWMLFYDSTGALSGTAATTIAGGTTSYQQLLFSATAPASTVTARIMWQAQGHTVGTWYVDDTSCVQVVQSTAININQFSLGPNGMITLSGFTWTPNSPSAGKIAWSSGVVSYGGNLYAVAAGNSSTDFWVYWQLSSPNSFQHAAQGGPSIPSLGPDDFIIALNNNSGSTVDLCINLSRLSDAGTRAVLCSSALFFINTSGKVCADFGSGGANQGRVILWNSTQAGTNTIDLDPNGPTIKVGGTTMNVP